MRFLLSVLFAFTVSTTAEKVSYENYKVFRMSVKQEHEVNFLKDLVASRDGFTFWSGLSIAIPTGVMVAPKDLKYFIEQMDSSSIKYEMIVNNVQDLINRQLAGIGNGTDEFGWKRYHTLDEIYNWMDSLPKKYPVVKVIKQVELPKEWISPATTTFLINELLTSKEPSVRALAESYDWYIFPMLNPDGYVYAHTTDRMWSKSRSHWDSDCIGVDLNRNWGYMWMEVGASNDPCSAKYAGRAPFSEIETYTMSRYLSLIQDKLFAYITFHSFAQLLRVPYGYSTGHFDNYNETYAIGLKAADALARRYGTKYTLGSVAEVLYPAAGIAVDWVKAVLKLPIVFSYDLPDKGNFGMMLPAEQIIQNGQEILDSLIALFEEAGKFGYPQNYSSK
ncbi:hypothetical protein TSAR_009736 [Trichomalopsis sarcophagae]|uniref:Peptidase M14 domain-containing protein n=1 Tax=Trichomalopsis sarcophagae TaxID=543379 RepID=A0A232F7M7_9HYME|nr:hypothetical protein TSAR_009736 [Trichomalopsis sarcophagae]